MNSFDSIKSKEEILGIINSKEFENFFNALNTKEFSALFDVALDKMHEHSGYVVHTVGNISCAQLVEAVFLEQTVEDIAVHVLAGEGLSDLCAVDVFGFNEICPFGLHGFGKLIRILNLITL